MSISIYNATVDSVMQLNKTTLTYALRIFQQELDGMLNLLRETPEAAREEKVLDDLASAITLRKVFTLRLEELESEGEQQKLSGGSMQLAPAA